MCCIEVWEVRFCDGNSDYFVIMLLYKIKIKLKKSLIITSDIQFHNLRAILRFAK